MAKTRTSGITVAGDGQRFIDKRYRGVRIGHRLGLATQEQGETALQSEMCRVDGLFERRRSRPLFRDCAARYLEQARVKRSFVTSQIHVRLLLPSIGDLWPEQVHDGTLADFIALRIAGGASATTINRSSESG